MAAWECYLIWLYRLDSGCSPLCNFGRLHPEFSASGNRSTGRRGGHIPNGNPRWKASVPALQRRGSFADVDWMNLPWSAVCKLDSLGIRSVPRGPGLYRIFVPDELLHVGQSASLRGRLTTHANVTWAEETAWMSYIEFPGFIGCQLLEVECDLIASYFEQSHRAKVPIPRPGRRGETRLPSDAHRRIVTTDRRATASVAWQELGALAVNAAARHGSCFLLGHALRGF